MIIGTAGHIDHGKTSLVRALTGVDTDRLAEEKRRGITIDLGFAYHTFTNGARVGFVDVPGHEKLVHTMLAGAHALDFIMLVVAADDGVMPQTREHLEILSLLGQTRGLVVLSRVDLINAAVLVQVQQSVRRFLAGSFLADAPVFPVSSRTGVGIENLAAHLAAEAAACPPRPQGGRLRYAVDRVFSLKGQGTVVTGSVLAGTVAAGETVMLAPAGIVAKVRSIHAQDLPVRAAQAGDRAALNLVGEKVSQDVLKRGSMVIAPVLDRPTMRFDARVQISAAETKPLKQWFPVRLHHAAQNVAARLVLLEGESLAAGCGAFVQVVTEKPVFAITGDRFVLRDTSATRTLGGGVVVDPQAPARKRRTAARRLRLAAMAEPEPAAALCRLLELPPFMVEWEAFCCARNLDEEMARQLLQMPDAVKLGDGPDALLLRRAYGETLLANIAERLQAFHASEPELPGMGLEKLRREIAPEMRMPCFRMLVDGSIRAGELKLHGAWLAHHSHEARLSAADEALWRRVEPVLLGERRFQPPRTRDFAGALALPEQEMRRILKSVARMGRAYEVAQDYFFPRPVLHEIVTVLQSVAAANPQGEFIAADLRDRLDNGRKVAILILEFLDRHGLTIRKGDKRRLNPHRLDLFSSC